MVDLLKAGTIKALVLDETFTKYVARMDCELSSVGPAFDTWDIAWAAPVRFA